MSGRKAGSCRVQKERAMPGRLESFKKQLVQAGEIRSCSLAHKYAEVLDPHTTKVTGVVLETPSRYGQF